MAPKYKALTLGAPGAANHLEHHDEDTPFVDCCPGDPVRASRVLYGGELRGGRVHRRATPARAGTECTTETGLPGLCDGAGDCV